MPGPALIPVHSDDILPVETDIAVIGGGVVGCFTALELAERGHRVLLLEKGVIGGEQSSRNWGWVRIAMRDLREAPLMLESIRLWQGLDRRIGAESGYVRSGIVFGCEDEAALESHETWLRDFSARGFMEELAGGPGMEMVGRAGMDTLFPGLSFKGEGALHAPVDGRAEPQRVAPRVAEAARARGAVIITGCAVLGLETSGGRICGIETERGPVRCQGVVMAAGVWTSALAGLQGIRLPQLKVLNTVMRTTAPPADAPAPELALWTAKYAFRRRADGGYSVASAGENIFEIVPDSFRFGAAFAAILRQEWASLRPRLSIVQRDEWLASLRGASGLHALLKTYRVLDPRPAGGTVKRAWQALCRDYPVYRSLGIEQQWAGMIEVVPDAVPVISRVEDCPGLVIATGFSGHGFGISPSAGKLAADLVTGDRPVVDPQPFRITRFSDGSPITVMGGV